MNKKYPPRIVPVSEIPKAVDAPCHRAGDDLIGIFRVCTQLERICTDDDGIGLSAVQIGVPWKLFVANYKDHYKYLVNCEYIPATGEVKSIEGCLSLRTESGALRRFEVKRHEIVVVRGKELVVTDGGLELRDFLKTMTGLYSIVYQHEIDHQFQRERMIDMIGTEIELS